MWRFSYCNVTTQRERGFCSFLVLKIGSSVQKGQLCGIDALLEEVDVFKVFLCLLEMDF